MEQATAPQREKITIACTNVSNFLPFFPMLVVSTGPKASGFFILNVRSANATAQMVYIQYWGTDHCHMVWEIANMAASLVPASTPAATGGVMKWNIGSPIAQNKSPVPIPPHRDMVIQFQVLKSGLASGPPILMLPNFDNARTNVRMMIRMAISSKNQPTLSAMAYKIVLRSVPIASCLNTPKAIKIPRQMIAGQKASLFNLFLSFIISPLET